MEINKFYRLFIFILLIVLGWSQVVSAQVKLKKPKIAFSLSSGYDSNILRVSQEADSNRAAGVIYNLDASITEWVYWNPQIRSYLSITGDYLIFGGLDIDDNWSFFAKFKTLTDILDRKMATWIPGIRWDIEVRYAMIDRYYSDRAAGAEFSTLIDRISGKRLALGDLFDRKTLRFFTGLRTDFDPWVSIGIGIQQEYKDYTDIGDPNSQDFFSLDNDETVIKTDLIIKPITWITFRLGYDRAARRYDHKVANDGNGNDLPDINREYHYNDLDLSLYGEYKGFNGQLRYLDRNRIDKYEGYFDYDADKFSIKGSYLFNSIWQISAFYETADKKYAHVTLDNQILENQYITLQTWASYLIQRNLALDLIFTHKKENSTYYKFTYNRNILSLRCSYKLR